MKALVRIALILAIAIGMATPLTGCEEKSPVEEIADDAEDAVNDAADAVEDAVEDAEDEAEDAVE